GAAVVVEDALLDPPLEQALAEKSKSSITPVRFMDHPPLDEGASSLARRDPIREGAAPHRARADPIGTRGTARGGGARLSSRSVTLHSGAVRAALDADDAWTPSWSASERFCERCGSLIAPGSRRDTRYCSGACRMRALRDRRAELRAAEQRVRARSRAASA